MTFKSIDFFESPVMRSLEKIAVKNGLVKNDPLDKYAKAEKKFDLTPSKNLDENILKFCAALRKEGYDKLALEVEQNFVLYKQAESEYSKILNEAHPDGSHDLEGVLGDNEIEDLLAQHSKILNVVNKKPTGKTASSKDLINAVKIVLAEDQVLEYNMEEQKTILNKLKEGFAIKLEAMTSLISSLPQNTPDTTITAILSTSVNAVKNLIGLTNEFIKKIESANLYSSIESEANSLNFKITSSIELIKKQLSLWSDPNSNALTAINSDKRQPVSDFAKGQIPFVNLILSKNGRGTSLIWGAARMSKGEHEGAKFQENLYSYAEYTIPLSNLLKFLTSTQSTIDNIVKNMPEGSSSKDTLQTLFGEIVMSKNLLSAAIGSIKTEGSKQPAQGESMYLIHSSYVKNQLSNTRNLASYFSKSSTPQQVSAACESIKATLNNLISKYSKFNKPKDSE